MYFTRTKDVTKINTANKEKCTKWPHTVLFHSLCMCVRCARFCSNTRVAHTRHWNITRTSDLFKFNHIITAAPGATRGRILVTSRIYKSWEIFSWLFRLCLRSCWAALPIVLASISDVSADFRSRFDLLQIFTIFFWWRVTGHRSGSAAYKIFLRTVTADRR